MSYEWPAANEDCGQRYEEVRQDLIALVRERPESDRQRRVTPTPDWSVHDVLAHVTGITEDLNRLDFGAPDPDAWTRAQVERHRHEPLDAVIATWDREAPTFEHGLRALGYTIGNHFVADLFIHATDVRTTLDASIDRNHPAVRIALDFYLDDLHDSLTADGNRALEVVTATETRVVGTGTVAARVEAEPFEMLRACAGRRTVAAIADYAWTGDAQHFAPRMSRYPMPVSDVGV